MIEEWKQIKDFPMYEVSNLGKVRSKRKVLKLSVLPNGYVQVGLYDEAKKQHPKLVHRLVAQAFIPNPDNLPVVDHINSNREENSVFNLRWCTQRDNMSNPITRSNISAHKSKSPVIQYKKDGSLVRTWGSILEASTSLGITYNCITNCCVGRAKSGGGYIWKYAS